MRLFGMGDVRMMPYASSASSQIGVPRLTMKRSFSGRFSGSMIMASFNIRPRLVHIIKSMLIRHGHCYRNDTDFT